MYKTAFLGCGGRARAMQVPTVLSNAVKSAQFAI